MSLFAAPVSVHSDNIGDFKGPSQVAKKYVPSSVKSRNRRALNDVSNKVTTVAASSDTGNCPPSKSVQRESTKVDEELQPPVSRLHPLLKAEHFEPSEIETMPSNDFDDEDDFYDVLPLDLRLTLEDVDRLMGRFRPSDTDDDSGFLDSDCVPPASDDNDDYATADYDLSLTFDQSVLDLDLSCSDLCLEDKTPPMELPTIAT